MEINPKHESKGQGFLTTQQVGKAQYLFLWCQLCVELGYLSFH